MDILDIAKIVNSKTRHAQIVVELNENNSQKLRFQEMKDSLIEFKQ